MNTTNHLPLLSLENRSIHGGCSECAYLTDCGGLPGQEAIWGSFTRCTIKCSTSSCSWTCPSRPQQFIERWQEVGSLDCNGKQPLQSPEDGELPRYIPVIHNGHCRKDPLEWPMVALPTYRVVRMRRNGQFGVKSANAAQLKEEFRLSPETQIFLASTAQDQWIETYWRYRNHYDVPTALANLGLLGMTTPNFSFFNDVPRPHTLWNRARIVKVANELAAAGVRIVIHVNALTDHDWAYWGALLKEQPSLRYVAKEFQTGLAHQALGIAALDQLRQLQDSVGRPLHLIAIGGGRYLTEIARRFQHFTIIDAEPFMRTIFRREIGEAEGTRMGWRKRETIRGEPLDARLLNNIRQYEQKIVSRINNLTSSQSSVVAHASRNRISTPPSDNQLMLPDLFIGD